MLTSEYAWGMLGDRVAPQPPMFAAPPFAAPPASTRSGAPPYAPGYPTPPAPPFSYPSASKETTGMPSDQATTADRPDAEEPAAVPEDAGITKSEPAAPAPPQWPPPLPPPPTSSPPTAIGAMPPPSPWERVAPSPPAADETPGWGTLVLTGAARGWMIFAIVWGSILFLGQDIAQNIVGHRQSSVQQFNTVNSDTNAANTAIDKAGQSIKSCPTVACLGPSYTTAAAKLTQLADDLHGMSLPSNAGGQAQNVESDASQLASVLTKLADSSDAATYRATAQSSNLGSILSSFATDSQSLLNTLNSDLS